MGLLPGVNLLNRTFHPTRYALPAGLKLNYERSVHDEFRIRVSDASSRGYFVEFMSVLRPPIPFLGTLLRPYRSGCRLWCSCVRRAGLHKMPERKSAKPAKGREIE